MKKVTLGFDLGVGSVGWSIIDNETNKILDLGSRLFSEPNLAVNRRAYRTDVHLKERKAAKEENKASTVQWIILGFLIFMSFLNLLLYILLAIKTI